MSTEYRNIKQKRDTPAQWAAVNPILRQGQVGWEMVGGQPSKAKVGDGVTHWNDLPYSVATLPDLSGYAPLDSPTLTGDPKAPTRAPGDNDTSIATTAHVKSVLANSPVLGGSPTTATPAASDDSDRIATTAHVLNVLDASPVLGGDPKAPTAAFTDNDSSIATTAFVKAVLANSPVLAGNPTATTPAAGDNDTSIATTAFVRSLLGFSQMLQVGTIPVTISSANSGTAALTFPVPFTGSGNPLVFAFATGTTTYMGGSNTPTNTGANITAAHKDAGSTASVTVNVNWIAVKL